NFGTIRLRAGLCIRHLFFFQAEDGIRDGHVTGVQTCALPISTGGVPAMMKWAISFYEPMDNNNVRLYQISFLDLTGEQFGKDRRSEERRVGKECRSRWGTDQKKKKMRIVRLSMLRRKGY